jgi:hypothetical protein
VNSGDGDLKMATRQRRPEDGDLRTAT